MNGLLFCVFISLCAASCVVKDSNAIGQAQEHWNRGKLDFVSIYRMPPKDGSVTYKFDFTREFQLWTRGSSDSRSNQLMHSDDFGKSWEFTDLPDEGIGADSIIQFTDREVGWALDTSTLLNTSNGGRSWRKIRLPEGSRVRTLNGLGFADRNQGCIGSSTSHRIERGAGTDASGIEVLCTTDEGRTWAVSYQNSKNDSVRKILSLQPTTIVLVDQTLLLVTQDKKSWQEKPLQFLATDIDMSADGFLWAACEDGSLRFSSDLGGTWQTSSTESFQSLGERWNSIALGAEGFGAVVGSHGNVAFTIDAGKTWAPFSDDKLSEDLWTVRVQFPYVAISSSKNAIFVYRLDR